MRNKPVLAMTMGDPSGIGPEVVAKIHASREVFRLCRPLVIGDPRLFKTLVRRLGLPLKVREISGAGEIRSSVREMAVLACTHVDPKRFRPGEAVAESGRAAVDCIETAVRLALHGEAAAVVTAPVNKAVLALAGCPFPGHTELLAHLTGTPRAGMLLVGAFRPSKKRKPSYLRILPATTHVALNVLPTRLTEPVVLSAIRLANQSARRDFGIPRPRVAVAALNPHGGEGGLFGSEEEKIILPAILEARRHRLSASGPWPADTLMVRAVRGEFDMVVSMYHDQAMIPVKLVSFGSAVNVTVGLPIIRTSVDHGTAYDIAWKGKADAGSLLSAVRLAAELFRIRKKGNR
jgi:4-hydroxythreonine-4-phosphate dehydrogenase